MNIKNNKNCKITINDEGIGIAVSKKEQTADELFEELGYKKKEQKNEHATYIWYYQRNGANEEFGIEFAKSNFEERGEIYCVCYSEREEAIYINMQELQAINKKCMELRLDMIKINNLKESIEYLKKINNYETDREPYYLKYELSEGITSLEWYEAILEKVKKYKPKRVIDIGSNINLFGYLFANEGIEYIGIDIDSDGCKPIETKNIKFIKANYYDVAEQFKNDVCISCLCVGYLIPFADVKCKKLIINSDSGDEYNYKCTAKEIKK